MSLIHSRSDKAVRELEVIPSDPRIALKLIELARDPATDGLEYAKWVQTDPSLTARILGSVGSAWFSPGGETDSVTGAIRVMGVNEVRMIALSHAVSALHQSLAMDSDSGYRFWRASVRKAFAARKIAECIDGAAPAEAQFAGLVQDLGVGVLNTIDSEALAKIHRDHESNLEDLLAAETLHFGMDHQSTGSILGQNLKIPMALLHSVTCHHHDNRTARTAVAISHPCRVASLLGHMGVGESDAAIEELDALIPHDFPLWLSASEFLEEVDREVDELDAQLGDSGSKAPDILASLVDASQLLARAATDSVSENICLRHHKKDLSQKLNWTKQAHQKAEYRAERDPLTQLFNRSGWDRRARRSLRNIGAGVNIGVAFFDLDHFKELNDEHGHAMGDAFLKTVGRRMQQAIRAGDIVCRWGGDEFVVLFIGGESGDCLDAAHRVQQKMQESPIVVDDVALEVSTTVGFVSVERREEETNLGDLLQLADEQLYKAKEERRGTLRATSVA